MLFENIILLDFLGMPPCFWTWLLAALGAFLLGWLLHWLLFCKRLKEQIVQLTKERDAYHVKATEWEEKYMALKYKFDELEKDAQGWKASLQSCEGDRVILQGRLSELENSSGGVMKTAGVVVKAEEAGDNYATLLGTENLQIVEGVGPKIEGLLKDGGIKNWGDFASATEERLREILDAAGPRYRIHNPASWPRQAKLAHEGKWDELIKYQKFTDGGREDKGDFETPAKVEKLISKKLGYSTNPEDLKVVEGIGPKIEGLLKDAGIKNWAELAAASVEKIQGVLDAAGDRYKLADPTTWAKQAGMAAKGAWGELKEFQDFLQGGKAPK